MINKCEARIRALALSSNASTFCGKCVTESFYFRIIAVKGNIFS